MRMRGDNRVDSSDHARLHLIYALAAGQWNANRAFLNFLPGFRILDLFNQLARPFARVCFSQVFADLDIEFMARGHDPRCVNRAFKGARIDGGEWDRGQPARERVRLALPLTVDVKARRPAG